MSLTFGEQLKIVLKQRNMSVKELAGEIEKFTGKPMSRQNLNQKLGRNNFQEKDMRMIAEILGLTFTLDILGGEVVKLPVEKVIEGNMTVAEVLNLKESEEGKTPVKEEVAAEIQEEVKTEEKIEETEISTGFAEAIEDKTNRVLQDVESVNFMKKKGSFEEPPINMQNYRSKKDLFINLESKEEVEEEVPQKSSEELIAELLREMEEIERDKTNQVQEAKERQEKWENRRKEKSLVSRIGKWFKSTMKSKDPEEVAIEQSDEEYLEEAVLSEVVETEENVVVSVDTEEAESVNVEDINTNNTEIGETAVVEEQETVVEHASENKPEVEQEENVLEQPSEEKVLDPSTEIENLAEMIPAEEIVFAPATEEMLGEINPYTGLEYETNSVRNHKDRIGYVQVYSREIHGWKDMTEWAFLGYQEKRRVEQGENYVPPIYLD